MKTFLTVENAIVSIAFFQAINSIPKNISSGMFKLMCHLSKQLKADVWMHT